MSLPKQVQAQEDMVREWEQQMQAQSSVVIEDDAEPAAPQAPSDAASVDETDVSPPPQEQNQPPVLDATSEDASLWRHKYSTLQGKFNAEVPRLNTQVKELQAQVRELTEKLEQTVRKDAPQPAVPEPPLVTDKDVSEFGSDLIDLIKRQASDAVRQARGEFKKELDQLRAENAELKQQLGGVAERQSGSDRRAFFVELMKKVPDYEAVNADPAFLAWLAQVDPMSGLTRQAYLDHAYQNNDAERTGNIFLAWKTVAGKGADPSAPRPTPKEQLQRHITPSGSKAAVDTENRGRKVWTTKDVQDFYTKVRQGHYLNRPDEAARIEEEIDLAVAEGRVGD